MKHTKEPWYLMKDGFSKKGIWNSPIVYAGDDELRYVAICKDVLNVTPTDNLENARRIVACVNACSGMLTEDLEMHNHPQGFIMHLTADLIEQRNELLSALKEIESANWHFSMSRKIAKEAIEKAEARK